MLTLSPKKITLPENKNGNDYIVGDIHGETEELFKHLMEINFDQNTDRLICCGDLIDRGPYSDKALDLLEEEWFFSVMGNHEYLMLSTLKYSDSTKRLTWLENGGNWISETNPDKWPKWISAIDNLPIAIEIKTGNGKIFGVTHADYPKSSWDDFEKLTENEVQSIIWSKRSYNDRNEKVIEGIDFLYHGHCLCPGGLILGNRHYIENGAYLGNGFITIKLPTS